MPPTARSGAIHSNADSAEPLDTPETDDESVETGEEKLRSGIQSVSYTHLTLPTNREV